MGKIRPLALAVVWHEGKLLVFEGRNGDEVFHRPLGGGIEFGETAEAALRREFREELGAELVHVRRLDVLENIFSAHDGPGHEIVVLFTAELVDRSLYTRDDLVVLDDGSPVRWLRPAEIAILYPAGLAALLSGTPPAR